MFIHPEIGRALAHERQTDLLRAAEVDRLRRDSLDQPHRRRPTADRARGVVGARVRRFLRAPTRWAPRRTTAC